MVQKSSFYLFLSLILLAPLPFASNRPWSWSLLSVGIGVLLILEAFSKRGSETEARAKFLKRMLPGLLLWGGVAVWIIVQMAPGLPSEFVHPLWFEAAAIIGAPVSPTISLDSEETGTALMRFLAYGGVFWLSARYCQDAEKAAFMLRAFVVASMIYALYGLVVFFSGLEMILWFDKWAYRGNLVSTFVNRNTYATYAGLGLITSIALTFDVVGKRLHGNLRPKELLRTFFETVFNKGWLPFICVVVTATALLLTHSRGGFLSASLATLVLIAALSYAKLLPRLFGYSISAIAILGGLFAFNLSGDIVVRRLEQTTLETSIRDDLYLRVIDAIGSNPILGTGYGTFEQAFLTFKTSDLSRMRWDKAHNSYLELAMELGWPATAAVIAAFVWLVGVYLNGLRNRRRRKVFAAIGLASAILVAAHSLVDFSLQIPGLTVSYALLAGMAWSQSWPSSRRSKRKPS